MATQTTDVLEEDAADLQFPKDELDIEYDWTKYKCKCVICQKEIIHEPIVRCVECFNIELCVQCFAIGLETDKHKNYHRYRLDRRHSPFFPSSDWPIETEYELLSSVLECGHGNWVDIAKRLVVYTPEEIERHFNEFYLRNCDNISEFKKFELLTAESEFPRFNYNPNVLSEEPPRFPQGTSQYRYFGGYNAARADFEVESDNLAENVVAQIDRNDLDENDVDYDLMKELQVVIVKHYNDRLKERERKKTIIKNHGLMMLRKLPLVMGRYDSTITKTYVESLFPFMQFLSAERFDCLLEGLHRESELRHKFIRLKIFRENGIKHLRSCKIFESLKASRDDMVKNLNQVNNNPLMFLKDVELDIQPNLTKVAAGNQRKAPPPLDIVLLPGYERLSEEERVLCATARVVPLSYLTYKEALVTESLKNNGIRLATARQLIKIDVNKTRKIFNFLRDNGLIRQVS